MNPLNTSTDSPDPSDNSADAWQKRGVAFTIYLDAAGNVVGSTTTWVLGGVPANNRTWFTTHVPAAAGYRVEILSFDWGSRGQ